MKTHPLFVSLAYASTATHGFSRHEYAPPKPRGTGTVRADPRPALLAGRAPRRLEMSAVPDAGSSASDRRKDWKEIVMNGLLALERKAIGHRAKAIGGLAEPSKVAAMVDVPKAPKEPVAKEATEDLLATPPPPAKKVIVLIGGCGDIGTAAAEAFHARGDCDVYATGAFAEEVESFRANHPSVTCDVLDICDRSAVDAYVSKFDRCDTLVNCAGINMRDGAEFQIDNFARVLDVDLTGTMSTCTAFRPLLAGSSSDHGGEGGSIINIASMYSYFGSGKIPAYAASKSGVVSLTKSLALAFAEENIRVNAVAPGFIATHLNTALHRDEELYNNIKDHTPLGRWGSPRDIAGPIVYLASPEAGFVTGATLPVDGGLLVSGPV